MNESDFQTKFSKWLHYNGLTGAFELKISKTPSFNMNNVKEHQLNALLCVKHHTFNYKIQDVGMSQKPFDCFCLKEQPAFIVLLFYTPGVKRFYMIDVDDFIRFKNNCGKKSMCEVDASIIGTKYELGVLYETNNIEYKYITTINN